MSGVYIKGMEMPKRGHTVTLTILGGGEVYVQYYDCKPHLTVPIVYKAVPVPDHGRLIDADALPTYDKPIGKMMMFGGEYVYTQTAIDNAPTIIPAEEGET